MKTWYRAVCDEHKECCNIFVSNPSTTSAYLSKHDIEIQKFLSTHYGCNLRFVHNDFDMEYLFNNNYKMVDYEWK